MPEHVQLLPHEANKDGAALYGGLIIATFYDRREEESDGLEALRTRMADILRANRWLMGRFAVNKDTSKVELILDEQYENVDEYIFVDQMDSLFEKSGYLETSEALQIYAIPKAAMLIDNMAAKLTKIGIVHNADKSKVVTFLSMTHLLGDGDTLYQIYRQFDINEPVEELNYERVTDFRERVTAQTSLLPTPNDIHEKRMKTLLPMFMRKLMIPAESRPPAHIEIVGINMAHVRKQKEQFSTKEHHCTANDVISMWAAKICPSMDYFQMIIDVRDRADGIDCNHAGNYFAQCYLRKHEMESPLSIRKWLKTRLASGTQWEFYPESEKEEYEAFMGAMHTNWANFYHEVPIDGYTEKLHIPAFYPMREVQGQKIFVGLPVTMVTFRPRLGQLAVLLLSNHPEVKTNRQLPDEMVSSVIMSE